MFLLSARSSQIHATSCLSLMSHHWVNNKCNRVKWQHWRLLIYALHNFLQRNKMLRVFRSNHNCPWKFQKLHRKTPVLESLFKKVTGLQTYFMVCFSPYPIIHVNYVKFYCLYKHFYGFLEIDLWKCHKRIISQQTYLYIRVTDILKFYDILFCTYCKGLFFLSLKNSHYILTFLCICTKHSQH